MYPVALEMASIASRMRDIEAKLLVECGVKLWVPESKKNEGQPLRGTARVFR